MLSASSCGASPLSPHTQSTLEKHLPGLKPKRFLQKNSTSTVDVACITGKKNYSCVLKDSIYKLLPRNFFCLQKIKFL